MWCMPSSGGNVLIKGKVASIRTVCAILRLQLKSGKALKMVLSDYAKIRMWRAGLGPTVIAELLERDEGIHTSVSLFIAR